jgi:hypothetical protein
MEKGSKTGVLSDLDAGVRHEIGPAAAAPADAPPA